MNILGKICFVMYFQKWKPIYERPNHYKYHKKHKQKTLFVISLITKLFFITLKKDHEGLKYFIVVRKINILGNVLFHLDIFGLTRFGPELCNDVHQKYVINIFDKFLWSVKEPH